MATQAPAVPSFKLVLVGDGGTGKVYSPHLLSTLGDVVAVIAVVAAALFVSSSPSSPAALKV